MYRVRRREGQFLAKQGSLRRKSVEKEEIAEEVKAGVKRNRAIVRDPRGLGQSDA